MKYSANRPAGRPARGYRAALAAQQARVEQDALDYCKAALRRLQDKYWQGYADAVADLTAALGLAGDPVGPVDEPAPAPCEPVSGLLNRPRIGRQRRSTR